MKIPSFLDKHHDNYFYNIANDWEEHGIQCNDNKEYFKSWGWSALARLPYLANVIVDVVAAPLALIGIVFGLPPAIFTCGKESVILTYSAKKCLEKLNHLFISTFGALVSPWLAHKGRDVNVIGYAFEFLEAIGHTFHKKSVFAIKLN